MTAERDPRIDPVMGDCLRVDWDIRRVLSADRDAVDFARNGSSVRNGVCSLARWRRWATKADIVRRGAEVMADWVEE